MDGSEGVYDEQPEDGPMLMMRLQGLLLLSALVAGLVWLASAV